MRARFEDASALVEEARTILRTHRREVERAARFFAHPVVDAMAVARIAGLTQASGAPRGPESAHDTGDVEELAQRLARHALCTVAATGAIDVMIPPSIPMIIFGVVGQQSVPALFLAGILPGILLTTADNYQFDHAALERPDLMPAKRPRVEVGPARGRLEYSRREETEEC